MKKIAIVGSNGAGKSTLIKLLLRLYDPDKGEILLNGVNIKDYDIDFYRKNVYSLLTQNYQMYAAAIAENVKMDTVEDDKDISHIEESLQKAGIDSKINALKNKTKTRYTKEFYDDGAVFSGGEKQKIALSRVVYNDKRCVILDEPSSALDPKAEYELNNYIFNYLNEKTVIIISHRLSTTRMADRIVLIENGKVAEDGSHNKLMRVNGKYAKMFEAQSKRYN